MKFIVNWIRTFRMVEKRKPMGRWNIEYCNKKIDQKIDLSNEDHCGPCGQYIIAKLPKPLVVDDLHVKSLMVLPVDKI